MKLEWAKVKNDSDFSKFFNFALENDNLKYYPECIDSLEKYKPDMYCHVLYSYDYYLDYKGSLKQSDFFVDDECSVEIDYKMRNIVAVNIDRTDSILTVYVNGEHTNFNKLIIELFDTLGVSYDLPQSEVVEINGSEYTSKTLGVFINCEMLPDTISEKTSWETLINTTKHVMNIYLTIRESRSEKVYGRSFNKLDERERKLIVKLVPKYIKIRFTASIFRIPPPPPPILIEEIIIDTIELDL